MILEILWAFFATLAFSIIFQVKGRRLILSSVGGGIGWLVFAVSLKYSYSSVTGFLFSAMAITIYSEIIAKKMKTTVTTSLIPSLIPLVPGSGIYFTMDHFVQGNYAQAVMIGRETLSITAAITIGIVFITSISQVILRILRYRSMLKKYRSKKQNSPR